jgi:hypothetical protein
MVRLVAPKGRDVPPSITTRMLDVPPSLAWTRT